MDDDIEIDDEQEHEHEHELEQEPVDEPDYDDQDEEIDQDDDDDDMDDDDGDADADDDDDDDGDDDRDDASVAASCNGLRRSARDEELSAATYLRKVQERRKLFRPATSCIDNLLGYQIEPMAAAPHSSQIHAMALSLDGQTLLTGGSDGFVRKYDIHATMNGKTMLTQNVRHGFVEGITRGGTLTAFWANEEHLPTNGASSSSSSFHQSSVPEKDRLVGVVHSLAIQQDSLWGMSGSESGNIHLYGVRHEPGVTRHVFRKHKGAVSALALTSDETTMISGGWDRGVHQWDLNTGQVIRSFPGHAGQLSSLSFRPYSTVTSPNRSASRQASPAVSIHPSAAGSKHSDGEEDQDAEDKARNEGIAAAGGVDSEADKSNNAGEGEIEGQKEGSAAPNGDVDAGKSDAAATISSDSRKPESGLNDVTAEASAESVQANGQNSTEAASTDSNAGESEKAAARDNTAADKVDTTSTPKRDAEGASAEGDTPLAAPEAKKEVDPTAPSSGPGDDPTEEELAFEAELNASLGMSLDGNGGTKADGTRPDSVSAGASGTTAGGLMVAGADQDLDNDDGDDLFGGGTPPASTAVKEAKEKDGVKNETNGAANDSDGDDSLFGGDDEDADGDADADMDAEADAEADGDADADGNAEDDEDEGSSDEDMPLAGRSMVKNPSSQSLLVAGGTPGTTATASPSLSIALPSTATTAENGAKPTAETSSTTAASAPSTTVPKKALPKPVFGGFSLASSFDAPVSSFSPDVMMSTSLSGQVILWDLRCPDYTTDGVAKGVHSLPLPAKIPPWCQSAIFNSTGEKVYVGRRNESVDEWDLRMPSARYLRSLRLPSESGAVYSLAAMPNARHIVCGSYDNIRLWDTQFVPGPGVGGELKVPFKIVAGHHGASLSSVLVDASCNFLISASGDRGWMGSSTEAVIIHDIKPLT